MTLSGTYIYSQLSSDSALQLVTSNYDLVHPRRCKFYVLGLHDNYLVEGDDGLFILRIYRNSWRSPEEIHFELELLAYLQGRNAPVAGPVPTTHGELVIRIESPEGERLAALFQYADGCVPEGGLTAEQCELLGDAVSSVHELSDGFLSKHQRPDLDVEHLVDLSVEAIKPFLDMDSAMDLDRFHKMLRDAWPDIPKEPGTYGICIGDVNPKNFHISSDGNVTLFDFDQCGHGYRAFEIGKFVSSLHSHRQKPALLNAFLKGYERNRCLGRIEHEAITYFEIVAVLWVMSIQAKNADRIG